MNLRPRGPAAVAMSTAVLIALAGCSGSGSSGVSAAAVRTPTTGSAAAVSTTSAAVSVPSLSTVTASSGTPAATSSTATTSSKTSASATPTTSKTTRPAPPKPVKPVKPVISANPRFGTAGLAPRTPITISAADGQFAQLTVENAEGRALKGTLNAAKTSWTLAEPLGYGATYRVSGEAVGAHGGSAGVSGTFDTVAPDDTINASISPTNGDVVGIAAPILISLGTDVTDPAVRARIEKAITIATSPKVEGSFAWIQHDDGIGLDWRPNLYWKPGTKVQVKADLYGIDFGNNLWGQEDLTSGFTIGRAEITKGDIRTHRLKVYRDGKLLFDFPTSFGLESDPGRVTKNGTYIVMSKEYLHLMSNPAYHYKNFKAYYAVRISNNGTFIHANDGTADVQGHENVTHGCANLTSENAKAFYDQTMYGDPVEFTGSSLRLGDSDGDNHDWSIPWSEWTSLSALHGAG